jgi:hypothetical protein
MCSLDGKIHYEELNRVIVKILMQSDLEAAISKIRIARQNVNGSYQGVTEDRLRQLLGHMSQEDQPAARMIALLSPAGFGGLLIERNQRADGFRHFAAEAYAIIQKTVTEDKDYYGGTTVQAWNAHFLSTQPSFTPITDLDQQRAQLAQLTVTESLSLQKSRIGQGRFRDGLFGLWGGCSVTGVTNPDLLTASHLKPWRISSNSEKLDPYNGLLLIPNLDRLLDKGLITFDPHGQPTISDALTIGEKSVFSDLSGHDLVLRGIFPESEKYLEYHRLNIFENWI